MMNRFILTFAGAMGALVALSNTARAEDPKSASLSVHPVTGANVVISEKEKLGVLAFDYRQLTSGLTFNLETSAPLDKETRMASFLGENKLIGGFAASATIGYDSAYHATNLTPAMRTDERTKLCEKIPELKAGGCQEDDVEHWVTKNAQDPSAKKYEDLVRPASSERENALGGLRTLRLLPGGGGDPWETIRWAIGATLSFSYDRMSAYRMNLIDDPKDAVKYELAGGLSATGYLKPFFAINLRAGGTVKQDPGAKTVKRCKSVASDDKDITGSECEDVPFIEAEPEGPKGSMYVRTAFTFTSTDKSLGGYPGAELRVALEDLIQKPRAEFRAVGFFTPVLGPTAARFGVGFDVSIPMSTATASASGGDAVFTPFVVVGAAPAKW